MDSALQGVLRPAELDGASTDFDRARVRPDGPGKNLHEGRLTGPVVSNHRRELARVDIEVNGTKRLHGSKRLR